mmetsp:Transcript_31603/g.69225  ORF Transcript_31603/g.69225 Transcript_31603/m.69225 type:complete len:502 (-) Transcript_31603:26-1531(-)|eukprot:CAMPEP_0204266316 /NCGR_PEP_ID=MMETSP0468-20130131/10247_1 /ASSEMBLY_ACC=CAM_ASM_000383 /TAXON_ID=2969 /ORGANISM="Oxyrrhis marina" /LENGTH=501 /DNA_ID=CAMNT_0051241369 /DNA_START=93 /DNA_END=1598 /DNA_ORIENTATION=+
MTKTWTSRDVSGAIEKIGFGNYQRVAWVVCGFDCFVDGAEVLVAAVIASSVGAEWGASHIVRALLVSSSFVGAMLGAAAAGGAGLADVYGRRPVMLWTYAGMAVFGMACSVAPNIYAVGLCRMVVGFSFGLAGPATTSLLAEIVPVKSRAPLVASNCVFLLLGAIYVCVVCIYEMPWFWGARWGVVCSLVSLPIFGMLPLTYYFVHESPQYLAAQGRYEEVECVLQAIAQMNGKGDLAFHDGIVPTTGVDTAVGAVNHTVHERISMIFGPRLFNTTAAVAFLFMANNFLYQGINYQFPNVFQHMEEEESLVPAEEHLVATLFEIPGLMFATFLVSQRHKLTLPQSLGAVSSFTATLFIAFCSVDMHWDAIAIPVAYFLKFCTSCILALTMAYAAEIFPSLCRGTGLGFCTGVGRVGTILVPLIYQAIRQHVHCDKSQVKVCESETWEWPYLLFVATLAASMAYMMFQAPLLEGRGEMDCGMDEKLPLRESSGDLAAGAGAC